MECAWIVCVCWGWRGGDGVACWGERGEGEKRQQTEGEENDGRERGRNKRSQVIGSRGESCGWGEQKPAVGGVGLFCGGEKKERGIRKE